MTHLIDNLSILVGVFVVLVLIDILLQTGVRKMEYQRNDLVRTNTLGYKGVEWFVTGGAVPDKKDGQPRYYLRKKGSFTELCFRTDEFDLVARAPARVEGTSDV